MRHGTEIRGIALSDESTPGFQPPRACFVIVWYGEWPRWLSFYLRSCSANSRFHWLIFTDNPAYPTCPANVFIKHLSRSEFEARVSGILGQPYTFSYGYKLCDLKPAYGHLFESELEGYEFWGYADLDVVYGDLGCFLTESVLTDCDVVTSTPRIIAGHCTLLRNSQEIRQLYRTCPEFISKFLSRDYQVFDEDDFSKCVKSLSSAGVVRLRSIELQTEDSVIQWSGRKTFLFIWYKGQLLDANTFRKWGYFHFIKSKYGEAFRCADDPSMSSVFVLSRNGFYAVSGVTRSIRLVLMLLMSFLCTIPWYAKLLLKVLVPARLRAFLRRGAVAQT